MGDDAHAPLFSEGFAVRDGFLSTARVGALRECMFLRRDRGEFRAARIGSDVQLKQREDIRGDFTRWITEPLFEAERDLLGDLEQLRLQINARGFLGLFDIELHYAHYPPGAFYDRHVDQPQGREHRIVSFVLYLNSEWRPTDGGELRMFMSDGTHRDIEPIGGRLIYFLTAGREHAVLRTQSGRASISGWLRARESTLGRQ